MLSANELTDIAGSTIRRYNMITPGAGVVVGVSGGADSMALLHLLVRMADNMNLRLHIAHVNHMIRGADADADGEFVIRAGKAMGIDVHLRKVDVPALAAQRGITLEDAGREARYGLFADVARECGLSLVAVAHNANDNAETVLMRILRGTGTRGLAGIPPVRHHGGLTIVRPLIEVSRDIIEDYCAEHSIEFRTDETNTDTSYMRNRVRCQLLPLLETDYNPSIRSALERLARNAASDEDCLHSLALEMVNQCVVSQTSDSVTLSKNALARAHEALSSRVLTWAYCKAAGNRQDLYQVHIADLHNLIRAGGSGDEIHLPAGVKAWLDHDTLVLQGGHGEVANEPGWGPHVLRPGAILRIEPCGLVIAAAVGQVCAMNSCPEEKASSGRPEFDWLCSQAARVLEEAGIPGLSIGRAGAGREWAVFDIDKLGSGDLVVRRPKEGDRIAPFGLDGSKKLSDVFTDDRVARRRRNCVPIVEFRGEVIFAAGVRASALAPVDPATSRILVIALCRNLDGNFGAGQFV